MTNPPLGAVVLYGDQSDVGLYPPVGPHWGPESQPYKIRTHGRNQKVYLFGALEAHTGQLYAGFWSRKNSVAFVDFLRELLTVIPDQPLHLILDNYGVHKSRRNYLRVRQRDIHFLEHGF